jgi:hypothetical protein
MPARPEFLSAAEAASYLRLDQGTLANWRSAGRGPAYSRIGGRVLYEVADLVAFVSASRVEAAA